MHVDEFKAATGMSFLNHPRSGAHDDLAGVFPSDCHMLDICALHVHVYEISN